MSSLSPSPKFRGVDTTTGLALVGGKLYTYASGTLTPKNTYTSSTLGAANQNPTILDSRGEADVWLDGAYKFILKDSSDVTIWTVDNITDPTNGATFTNATFAGTTALVNLTVSGTTALGDAAADTLSVSGSVIKNGTGNWSLPAPSAGVTLAVAGGTSGTVTIAAPSSGTPVTINALAGANARAITLDVASATSENLIAWNLNAVSKGFMGLVGTAGNVVPGTVQNDLVIRNAQNILISADGGTTANVKIATAGNVTITAPTAGVGLTQTGFAGSDTAIFNGGTSGSFRINTTGVPYGTSLHNNAGAVTGTTNQYVCSGTYTPTVTLVTNCTASTATACQWIRVGNVVTVSGKVAVTGTAAAATEYALSLPIASALTAAEQLGGVGAVPTGAVSQLPAAVLADAANDRASFTYLNAFAGSQVWAFTFTYVVLS